MTESFTKILLGLLLLLPLPVVLLFVLSHQRIEHSDIAGFLISLALFVLGIYLIYVETVTRRMLRKQEPKTPKVKIGEPLKDRP